MNRDDVIKMAREAGITAHISLSGLRIEAIERFAQLVAAHERERCIEAVWQQQKHDGGRDYKVGLQMAVNAIRQRGSAN